MAADQVMEMMNCLSPEELQLVTTYANNLIGSLQQGTNDNSTNFDELISASPISYRNGFDSPRSLAIPEAASPAATNNKERIRRRNKFVLVERVNGKPTNVVRGLQLYEGVFDPDEQEDIVKFVYELQKKGKKGQFTAPRTYSETARWLRGKGGCTMQFGSKYAEDRRGNRPGSLTNEVVDPLPRRLEDMIKKLIDYNILSATCKPDNCVVNIYNIGDCLPPYTYHTDFVPPSCTVSLLTQCNILFGVNNKKGTTELSAPIHIPLSPGSVLVLNGNAAKVAKQCVPRMTGIRISITFRKMDEGKLLLNKSPETGLKSKSAPRARSSPLGSFQNQTYGIMSGNGSETGEDSDGNFTSDKDDSPLSSNASYSSLSSASL